MSAAAIVGSLAWVAREANLARKKGDNQFGGETEMKLLVEAESAVQDLEVGLGSSTADDQTPDSTQDDTEL